jgi:hypothetical protein
VTILASWTRLWGRVGPLNSFVYFLTPPFERIAPYETKPIHESPRPAWRWRALFFLVAVLLFAHGCHGEDVDHELFSPHEAIASGSVNPPPTTGE